MLKYYYFCKTMAGKKKIIFVVNPISGTTRKSGIGKLIENNLDKEYYDFSIVETQYSGHASEISRDAKDRGVDVVVAVVEVVDFEYVFVCFLKLHFCVGAYVTCSAGYENTWLF